MNPLTLTGPGASSLKYDLLTAVSVMGLHGDPRIALASTRLIATITARYNWRLDELSVGQRDLSRMWNVTERTVKREIKYWLDSGFVICKRRGVRGKVAAYRLNYPELFKATESVWSKVGPDFVERMTENSPVSRPSVVQVDFAARSRPDKKEQPDWQKSLDRMQESHPDVFKCWMSQLTFLEDTHGIVRLAAPSRFVAQYVRSNHMEILAEAVQYAFGPGRRIVVLARDETAQ